MTKRILSILVVALAVLSPLLLYSETNAETAGPDSAPTISSLWANRNLAAEGDILIHGLYNLPYETLPVTPADQTYIFRLLHGSTEIGRITPFPYFDRGYNEGLFSFYLQPGVVEWGTPLTIRICQNPVEFSSPQYWDYVLSDANYSTLEDQDQSRIELETKLTEIINTLASTYDISLMSTSAGRDILTPYGETYLGGAVRGLQSMAPGLYLVQGSDLNMDETNWTTEQFDAYEDRFEGTWVGEETEATAEQIGITPTMTMALFVTVPVCLAFIIFSSFKFRRAEPGYIVCALMLIMSVLMGWIPKPIFASIYQLCGIYIAFLVFYSRG